jgi:hypothetical protein
MDCSEKYLYEATKEFYDVENTVHPVPKIWKEGILANDTVDFGHLCDLVSGADRRPSLFAEADSARTSSMLDEIQRTADFISSSLGLYSPEYGRFKHGPGAVSELSRRDYKYEFRHWGRRLEMVFPFDRFGTTPMGLSERLGIDGIDIKFEELASNLIAVPKTQKGPRLIASEPTCHQWCQQSIRDYLYETVHSSRCILHHSVRFNSQEESRLLALEASRTGKYATIDLKSASDRLSCSLVQRIFRRNKSLLEAFMAVRTRFIVNRIDQKCPLVHELNKFSTQGSALTFPVQSIVFATICIGVGRYLHRGRSISLDRLARQVRVYGDDIIVPVEWEPLVEEALHLLGLRVNHTKTHATGFFRESCGMDAFRGYDVTPPYVSRSLVKSDAGSIASYVEVSNNFHKKGFWNVSSWMTTALTFGSLPVVKTTSGEFGLVSFSGYQLPSKNRWNTNTHQWECRVLAISARTSVTKLDSAACLLQYFTESQVGHREVIDGVLSFVEEPIRRPFWDYESGIAVAGPPVVRRAWVAVGRLVA